MQEVEIMNLIVVENIECLNFAGVGVGVICGLFVVAAVVGFCIDRQVQI